LPRRFRRIGANVTVVLPAIRVLIAMRHAESPSGPRGCVIVVVRAARNAHPKDHAGGAVGARVRRATQHRAVAAGLRSVARAVALNRAIGGAIAPVSDAWRAPAKHESHRNQPARSCHAKFTLPPHPPAGTDPTRAVGVATQRATWDHPPSAPFGAGAPNEKRGTASSAPFAAGAPNDKLGAATNEKPGTASSAPFAAGAPKGNPGTATNDKLGTATKGNPGKTAAMCIARTNVLAARAQAPASLTLRGLPLRCIPCGHVHVHHVRLH
jgi:hypothetical protein